MIMLKLRMTNHYFETKLEFTRILISPTCITWKYHLRMVKLP